MLEGFCEVNIKTSWAERLYNRRYMSEGYRPFFEGGRPLTPSEKRRWKIRHEPRMYEYQILSPDELERNRRRLEGKLEESGETKITAGGILLLAILESLNCLSNSEGSGIDGLEIETPQSNRIGRPL